MSPIAPARLAEFRKNGYLHAPGILSRDEIETFRAAADEAVATRKRNDTRQPGLWPSVGDNRLLNRAANLGVFPAGAERVSAL